MSDLSVFSVFSAWEPLLKARPTKDLDQHKRLSHLGERLKGKKAKYLAFTTSYPGQEGQKKYLGTVDGNQQFLLGYANPRFHLAPYHWQVIDPSLTDEEAEKLHLAVGHPSKPELWNNLDVGDEGDLDDGEPHLSVKEEYEARKAREAREAETITVRCGAGVYSAVPSERMVYGQHNGHRYKWDLLRNSYLAAMNPELTEKMESAFEMEKSLYKRTRDDVTSGFDNVSPFSQPLRRDVVQDGDTYRVVVR